MEVAEKGDVMYRRTILALGAALLLALVIAVPAGAAPAQLGHHLYLDGRLLTTLVVSSPLPNGGIDPIYAVTNGVMGQEGVAAVGPGVGSYHGGAWAVNLVTFKPGVTPYLVTSAAQVFAAESAGDVTIMRVPEADFRCPVLPY
jgi:hypothetical protein